MTPPRSYRHELVSVLGIGGFLFLLVTAPRAAIALMVAAFVLIAIDHLFTRRGA